MVPLFALQVENVRVHVYRPHRNRMFVSALIVWDSSALNSSQIQYAVNAYTAEGLPLTTLNAWESVGANANVGDRGAIHLELIIQWLRKIITSVFFNLPFSDLGRASISS